MYTSVLVAVTFLASFARASPVTSNNVVERCDECVAPTHNDGLGLGSVLGLVTDIDLDIDILGIDLDTFVGLDTILGLGGIDGSHHAPENVPAHNQCSWAGCNEGDLWNWTNDLSVKVDVILALLDGQKDPVGPCNDLLNLLDVSLAALAKVDIDATKGHGSKWSDIAQLFAGILVKIVVALNKYNAGVLVSVVAKLDAIFHLLLLCLDAQVSGFDHHCGSFITDAPLFLGINLQLTVAALGL